jgi:hypothetical protein
MPDLRNQAICRELGQTKLARSLAPDAVRRIRERESFLQAEEVITSPKHKARG